jgi:hypothetical protein
MHVDLYPKGLPGEVASQFSTRPIFNLITTTRARYVASSIEQIKYRLSRESTVLVSGYGIGVLGKL